MPETKKSATNGPCRASAWGTAAGVTAELTLFKDHDLFGVLNGPILGSRRRLA